MAVPHQWVLNKSKGAFLKDEYLEAYLIQAVLIETVAKDLVRFKLPKHVPNYQKLVERFERMGFNDAIDYLAMLKVIQPDVHGRLKDYNKTRNAIFHKILAAENEEKLNKLLKDAYLEGTTIHDGLLKLILRVLRKARRTIPVPESGKSER